MNNAMYLRVAELARIDWFILTEFRKKIKNHGFGFAWVATNVRYRRELKFNKKFIIKTRAIFWDETNLIMEQKFCDIKTNFVYSIIFGKYVLIDLKTRKKVNLENLKQLENNDNNKNINIENDNINILKSGNRERLGFYKINWYEFEDNNINGMNIIQERNENDENDEKMEILPPTKTMITKGSLSNNDEQIQQTQEQTQGNGVDTETIYSGTTNDEFDDNLIVPMIDWNDNYQCRNKLPHSVTLWMQCLEQSSVESRRNLFS